MVSESGIIPLPKHVTAVQDFPPPGNLKQLQQFLGMINFYRRFLPSIARTLKPLTDLLKGNPKQLAWSDSAAAAFTAAKAALVAAVPLTHPAPGSVLALALMPPTHTWVPRFSNLRTERGGRSPFSPKNCLQRNAATLHSIENSWPPSRRFGISVSCWRAVHSVS